MKCFVCNNCFPTVRLYKAHLTDKHAIESIRSFCCIEEQCARTFSSWHSLQRHLHAKHTFSSSPQVGSNITAGPQDLVNFSDVSMECPGSEDDNVQSISVPSLDEASILVKRRAVSFISNLYQNPAIPRSLVQSQVEEVQSFHSDNIASMREQLSHALKDHGSDVVEKCQSVIDAFEDPFQGLKTEYKRLQYFESNGAYIPPQEILITSKETIDSGENRVLHNKPVAAQYVPISATLKKVFQSENYLQRTLDYVDELCAESETGVISNFVQGLTWQAVRKEYEGKTVLPFFLFFDDFETSDPLSGHSNKLGGVYMSIPCVPPEMQAKLKSIYLVLLFESDYRKEAGNEMLFRKVLDDMEDLQKNGMKIDTPDGSFHVYFKIGLITGDNLGLHSILGFVEGFRANFPCRFCKCHRNECQSMCDVNVSLLRNVENYNADLPLNYSETGIKEDSIWNKLSGFHVTKNFCVDVMHDLLEGVCIYDFQIIVGSFLDSGYFTLEDLNFRIKSCRYLPDDSKPPPVKVVNGVLKFSFTAAEMLCFVRYFNVMVGPLVPESDLPWQLYLVLRRIICLVTCKKLQRECTYLLEGLVSEHHQLYISLAGQNSLKPKHHHMVHYGLCMRMSGPLCLIWAMRSEGKHRTFKTAASVCASRVNPSLTFAKRNQLVFAAQLLSVPSTCKVDVGPGDIVTVTESDEFQPCLLLPNFEVGKSYYSPHWVKRKGYDYRAEMIILIDVIDGIPLFAVLKHFLLDDSRSVFVLCDILRVLFFDMHLDAYCTELRNEKRCLNLDQIYDVLPASHHVIPDGRKIVSLRSML